MIVELSRLLVTLTTTAIGFQLGRSAVDWFPAITTDGDLTTITGALLGAGLGYVAGGALGRWVRHGLDRAPQLFGGASGPELFAGAFGLMAGLAVGVVAAIPVVVLLPAVAGWPLGALLVIISSAFGGRLFAARSHELLTAVGLRSRDPLRAAATLNAEEGGTKYLIDSAAAIDGRILELARSGLMEGDLLVPGFVLDELQGIADSKDRSRRRRGRRGLDVLDSLRDVSTIGFMVLDDSVPEHYEVDAKLVTLSIRSRAVLVTTDHNLARAAELRGITVLNPHALGESMRPTVMAGDVVSFVVEREGSGSGQGVGYLEDGTMVVLEGGSDHIGEAVTAEVSNSLRTSVGRLLFAKLQV